MQAVLNLNLKHDACLDLDELQGFSLRCFSALLGWGWGLAGRGEKEAKEKETQASSF